MSNSLIVPMKSISVDTILLLSIFSWLSLAFADQDPQVWCQRGHHDSADLAECIRKSKDISFNPFDDPSSIMKVPPEISMGEVNSMLLVVLIMLAVVLGLFILGCTLCLCIPLCDLCCGCCGCCGCFMPLCTFLASIPIISIFLSERDRRRGYEEIALLRGDDRRV